MSGLTEFLAYLDNRKQVLEGAVAGLESVQQKYENFFAEVSRVRETELRQLTTHIVSEPGSLGAEISGALERAQREVDAKLDAELARLRVHQQASIERAEQLRQESVQAEQTLRADNVELDAKEERLKAKVARLLDEIAEHNQRIRQLGKGWGFIANLFKMRNMARHKEQLREEHDSAAAQIEQIRGTWASLDAAAAESEAERRAGWIAAEREAAEIATKLSHVQQTAPRIRLRSTVERVLFELEPQLSPPGKTATPCPRCKAGNAPKQYFCRICAHRLTEDRPDAEGSLEEIAELNLHHRRFAEGMKGCQQIIALTNGLHNGVVALRKSVADVLATQQRHSLRTLRIKVPGKSRKYGETFDAFAKLVWQHEQRPVHPVDFAAKVDHLVESVFTEPRIKGYFETMGKELSRQADSQW